MPPWKLSSEAMLTILPGALRGDHVAAGELGELEDAGEVDLQDLSQSARGYVDGVVAEMVPALLMRMSMRPRAALAWVKSFFGAGGDGEVGLEGVGAAAGGGDGGGGVGGGAAVAVDGDGGSGLRERGGDGGAEAGGGSGDEGDFVVEAEEVEDVLGVH